nr:MAG TPA_asm: hypothetical protein [Caudoviricetes sp.]
MTQNRSPTSPTPFRGKPPFYLCGSFGSCRRWGDEYQPGANPGHSAISKGEVIHMATTFDTTMTLQDACDKYHAGVTEVTTLLELIGGLSKEEADQVLYQASIAAAAKRIAPTIPA